MFKQRPYVRLAVILLMLLCTVKQVFAIDDKYKALPMLGSAGQIKVGAVISVQDDVFFNPSLKPTQTTYGVKNFVSVKIDESSRVLLPANFSIGIHFRLIATRADANGNPYIDSTSIQDGYPYVAVNYRETTYDNKSVFPFDGAFKAVLRITSIDTIAGIPFSSYSSALVIENEMLVNRDFNFSCINNAIRAVTTDASYVLSKGELKVSWPKDRAADEYDLEWTYIDKSALRNSSTNGVPDPQKIFTNNATRVSISSEDYFIPLLYDDTGTLYYRVRPVQIKRDGQRLEANWSSDWVNGLGKYVYNGGHEPLLNWQASTSFAEEGKRKSVVQYFDGSLRGRQTVTKDNTTDTTVVAETMYDYQGRPVIQVLPSPSLSAMIKYTPNFNKDVNNAEYDKKKYDDLLTATNYCGTGAPAMSVQAGASNYYSPNNPNKNNGYNQYIPDAKGYPFAETKYTQDNTGRISRQGGVGISHQIGKTDTVYFDSHETRYYYGAADAEDIDAMFGSEAGNASHYFKNMVRDANGQYSVSYVDIHGRTVATALAGKPVASLDTLQSARTITITKKLIDSVNNIRKGTSIEAAKGLIVTKGGNHKFTYALNADSIRLLNCLTPAANVCYDCLYNLTITISDDCNNQSLPGNKPYVFVDSNFTIGRIDTSCNAPKGFSRSFTINLKEGSYLVTKKLSISKYGMDYYRDSIFTVKNTCKTLNDFIAEQRQKMPLVDCAPSCEKCSVATFRSWTLYRPYYMQQLEIADADTAYYRGQALTAFNNQLQACNEVCGTTVVANSIRRQMLADVSPPSGQYANVDAADEYSIFAPSASNQPKRYRYSDLDTYNDETGKADTVFTSDGLPLLPKDMRPDDFISNFKNPWAESLIQLHPEYCKLKLYESDAFVASQQWDARFEKITTYKEAKDSGFLNPLGYTDVIVQPSSVIKDPFFNTAINPTYAASWRGILNDSMRKKAPYTGGNFIDSWSLATIMAQCDTGTNACYFNYAGNTKPFGIDPSCTGTLDIAWRYFQQLYKAEKTEVINKILAQACDGTVSIDVTKHTLNFPDKAKLDDATPSTTQAGKDAIVNLVNSSCTGYATQWWKELGPCNYTRVDSINIMNRLIGVCQQGGDAEHPFGASTIKPGNVYKYKSFEEVITLYNDSLRTAAAPRNILSTSCNAYMISAPAAYDNRPVYGNQELFTKPDSCQCATVNALYTNYQFSAGGDASFSDYLRRVTGTQVSNAVLDSLRGLCDGSIVCKALATALIIPPVLQCGVKDVCASCSLVGDTYAKFTAAFPGVVPVYNNTDSLQRTQNILFERFMNYQLGFSKQASDYLKFMEGCNIKVSTAACNTLQQLMKDFKERQFKNLPSPDTIHFGVFYSFTTTKILKDRYADIFTNGYAHVPQDFREPYPNPPLALGKYDTLCVNNNFTIETRLKADEKDVAQRYCGGLNFAFWDDHNNAFSPTFEPPGSRPDCGAGTFTIMNRVHKWDTTNFSRYYRNQLNWYRIKMVAKDFTIKVYVNDTLITSIPYTSPINKITNYGFGLNSGYVDYVKVYDGNGTLQYLEDFEDARNSASNYPEAFGCQGNCDDLFIAYYNQRQGTSFNSITQIQSLYNNCGLTLSPCSDTIANKLRNYNTEFINDYYNYGRKYDDSGCDTVTWKVDYGSLINNTGVTHNRVFHDGIMQFPDTLAKGANPGRADYDFQFRDSACVNGKFSIEYRYKDPVNPLSQAHGHAMEIYSNRIPGYWTKLFLTYNALSLSNNTASFINYTVQEQNRNYFQNQEFRQDFSYWRIVKYEMIDSVLNFYVDGQLLKSFNFPRSVSMSRIYGVGFSEFGDHRLSGAYDWIKMYDGNGKIFYYEDFNDCNKFSLFTPYIECPKPSCSDAFTQYFNSREKTNYSFHQLDSVYHRYDVALSVCSNAGPFLCGRSAPLFPPVALRQYSPCDDSSNFIITAATMRYKAYKDSLNNVFNERYLAKCLNAYKKESFTVLQPMSEFHYTLYYYDQAGNLVRTVPPEGVDMTVYGRKTYFDSVTLARKKGTVYKPKHRLKTDYRYNTLNQVTAQNTPDAGLSNFWYDRLGRLSISQNARQKAAGATEDKRQYSYTRYDYLGRIKEVGQVSNLATNAAMSNVISRNPDLLDRWLINLDSRKEQVTRTFYDFAYTLNNTIPLNARNLRGRVAYTTVTDNGNNAYYNAGTFYSYDVHGNVDTLLQDYGQSTNEATKNIMNRNANRWARMVYKYDLVSGKVNQVSYNPKYYDVTTGDWVKPNGRFYHRYNYDAENKLTSVETSTDSIVWEKDARYEYYKHGPLARTVLGDGLVHGLDYAYTIQGWLKGVNSTSATSLTDMGADGKLAGQNINIARDVLGYSLNYFDGDYAAINGSVNPIPDVSAPLNAKKSHRPLYNGNISSMAVNIKPLGTPYLYNYKYDQLNRLTGMEAFTGLDTVNNNWRGITATKLYNERVSYDANGNIKRYDRYFDNPSVIMDSLRYNYASGTNKLLFVSDASQGWVNGNRKIKNQSPNNYSYDEIGNLTGDASEYLSAGGIKWNVYGKITEINHSQPGTLFDTKKINYYYDASGNRIGKKVIKFGSSNVSYTWYVRDAQGNVMNVYTAAKDTIPADTVLSTFNLVLSESHIYGSSRLAVLNRTTWAELYNSEGSPLSSQRGFKFFELSDHRGNVMAVISDKKIGHTSNGTTLDYYKADVVSATDYYPFGMVSRTGYFGNLSLGYRYGFNGKENDNEAKGEGNQVDFENRIYDPRIGRWYSLDPMQAKYPNESHYALVSNNPILYADKDGRDKVVTTTIIGKGGKQLVLVRTDKDFFHYKTDWRTYTIHDGIPGKEFLRGFKEDVYENYVIDLNNPKNNSHTIEYKTVATFNHLITYFGDMLFSGGNESSKSKFGYIIYGSGNVSDNDKKPRAANGSEVLDIDNLINVLGNWREFGVGSKQEPFDLMKDGFGKATLEGMDNVIDGSNAFVDFMKEAFGGVPRDDNRTPNFNNTEGQKREISKQTPFVKILPSKAGSKTDTSDLLYTPYNKRDTLYRQPYFKSKSKE